jgi:hypothetical protein
MMGASPRGQGFITNAGATGSFPISLAADLNADGNADVVGSGATNVRISLLNGTTVSSSGFLSNGSGVRTRRRRTARPMATTI